MKKKIIILGASLVILLIIAYGFVGNYFYNFALNADQEKEFLEGNPHLQESEAVLASVAEEAKLADDRFSKEHPSIQMQVTSTDVLQLNLNAFVYENDPAEHKWAIVVHGYTSKAKHMTRYVRNFYEQGYHVLAPDLRGHGESEGDYIGMGWHDRKDMLLWIDQILQKDPEAEIVLFGVSMGGATVMMSSGEEDLPENVKVIVEDCGYASVSDVFIYQLDDLFGLPEFPVMNAANTVTKLRAGYDLYEASAVEQVAKSTTPMLFIHGDQDTFVPFEMVDEVYEAANVEKEKLIIPEAGHGDAEKVDPETYWNTVWEFVEKYIE
ncbi:alpha/beta hydrolase [Mesobacillus maritimus]|uniref:alpha/beta hydrolase n=1 Tax=Mesobacillus maritimus TaxID=1643336 RepID=UPI002041865A|nr:alpha/beta hydrolase [Mesobacillus maritimus]MCM3586583.1 alpha/beta hydrolase [Mesobacillus maritimus]